MGNTNRRRLLLNPEQGGVPLVGLVDKYIDDNKLNEQFSQQSVDEHLSKLCDPNVVEMLWETFGICLEVVKDVGPCLQAVLCLVDGYTPLLDAQLSQFAFDLVTIDWSQVSIKVYFFIFIHYRATLLVTKFAKPWPICILPIPFIV